MQANTFRVLDVRAINGVTIEVEFNKPVTKEQNDLNGKLSIVGLALSNPVRSEDGKVLSYSSVVGGAGEDKDDLKAINVTNASVVVDPVKSKDSASVTSARYVGLFTYKDTVRPTVSVERVDYNTWKFVASEPFETASWVAAGKFPGGTTDPADDKLLNKISIPKDLILDDHDRIIGFYISIKDTATIGKNIELTVNGLADFAGNLVDPQPSKLNISLAAQDKVAPAISSITQTGAKTFKIAFDKPATFADVDANGVINPNQVTVGAAAASEIKAVAGSDTEYVVTVASNLKGIQTVTVPKEKIANDDGYLNQLALTKNVTFTEDTVAPKATAAFVTVDGAEYIQLTFDKDVNAGLVNVVGTKVKDYITTDVSVAGLTTEYAVDAAGDDIENVLLVSLTNDTVDTGKLLQVDGAVYTLAISNNVSNKVLSKAGYAWAETLNLTFTRGKDVAANTSKVTLSEIKQGASPDKIEVSFSGAVDGASAINKANYTIANATVESAVLNSTTKITLTLTKNSNNFSGLRNYEIKNIKASGSSVVSGPFTGTVNLAENVRPTVESAKYGAASGGKYTTILVTFNEGMGTTVANGFEVYVGTSTTNRANGTTVSGKVATVALNEGIDATEVAAGNVRVVVPANAVKDLAGNYAETVTATVTE